MAKRKSDEARPNQELGLSRCDQQRLGTVEKASHEGFTG